MDEEIHDVIIIGSGPGGYTAAIYAARAELKPLLISGSQPGGQLMLTSEVENWPGEPNGVMGPDLMDKMKQQALRFGTTMIEDLVVEVDFSHAPYLIKTEKKSYGARTVIIATGASAKWLGISGEKEFQGKGVSACATCDGFFFKDKKVIVVGGGDSAMEEATFITKFAREVVVAVRGNALRASKIMQDRAMKNPKISFLWNVDAQSLTGEGRLKTAHFKNNVSGEEISVDTDGFFVAIGHKPNTTIFAQWIELDPVGYVKHQPDSTKTNLSGVFACGDVMDPWYRQAVTAAGTGCMAALEAERYLAHSKE